MVGGNVIGIARGYDNTLIHVQGTRGESGDRVCIRVIERRKDNGDPIEISVGDSIWWQGRDAMWTPLGVKSSKDPAGCGKRWDIHLPRVGWTFASSHAVGLEEKTNEKDS